MSRIAYVNGQYLPHRHAQVHVEDRGYQFADGVYEVIAVVGGRLIDEAGHLQRLGRSLDELDIAWPVARAVLPGLIREVVRRNRVRDGIVYMQITRGVARRDHAFPTGVKSALVITARSQPANHAKAKAGVGVITVPDQRWARCDIKTVSLLPNILAKQQAREAGAYEAWQVDDEGHVTEGSSSNAWIVTRNGEIVTRRADNAILNGITRIAALQLADLAQLKVIHRPFSVDEAKAAREAFITSATSYVIGVTSIDGQKIGDGRPGPVTTRLRELYLDRMSKEAAAP
jgi:D-alanine transaminase